MRTRSSALAITNNTKKRMNDELGLTNEMNEDEKVEKISHFLETQLKMENKATPKTFKNDFNITIPPPQYLDIKKEYISKEEKPILFHDKAKICSSLNKKFVGDIEPYSQHVDFDTFLSQFKSDEEVDQLEILDILNLDLEKIGELKEKISEYTELTSQQIEQGEKEEGKEDLLVFLCEKLNEIKKNEINIQVFINNIEKVDSICFSNNKTDVYFK